MLNTFNRSPAVFKIGQPSPTKGSALASPLKINIARKLELPGIRTIVRAPTFNTGAWNDYAQNANNIPSAKKPKAISIERGQQDTKTPVKRERQMTEVLENIVRSNQKVEKRKIEHSPKNNFNIFEEKPIFKTEYDFKISKNSSSSIRFMSKHDAGERSLNLSAIKNSSYVQPTQSSIENFDRVDPPPPISKAQTIKISGLQEVSEKLKPSLNRFKSLDQETSYLSRISKMSPQKKRKPQKKIQVKLETVLEQHNGMILSSTAEC